MKQLIKSRVAVLMAVYNGVLWIEDQVKSILAQQDVDVHLFVSVDLSSDGTEQLIDFLASTNPRINVLPHGKKFGGAGANFYRLVKDVNFEFFDYISFSDQDDLWIPTKIVRAVEVIKSRNADAYSSNVTAFWPDGRQVLLKKSYPQVSFDYLFEAAGPGCTYVLSNALAIEIKLVLSDNVSISAISLHDWFFYAFARANRYHWVIDDFSGVFYRQHLFNQVGANVGLKAFIWRFKKLLSGWAFAQSLMIANAVGVHNISFVKNWSPLTRKSMLYLAYHSFSCRRRFVDKLFFAFFCLLLSLIGINKNT